MMFLVLAIATFAILPACADDIVIPVKKLPASAQEFLNTHFAGSSVVKAVHDRDVNDNDYTVWLSDGSKVEFNSKGKWKSVENKKTNVPDSVVPASIKEYVSTNYSSLAIVKIEKNAFGYEVELSNDLDLRFNSNGDFVGLDD